MQRFYWFSWMVLCTSVLIACELDPATAPFNTDDTDDPIHLDDNCSEVQAIMNENCVSCHGVVSVDGLDLRDLSKVIDLPSTALGMAIVSPEDADNSYLLHKMMGTHLQAGGKGLQMPPSGALAEENIATLEDWIVEGALCEETTETFESEVNPNDLDQATLFTCNGSPSSSPSRIRRIDHLEFRKRIGQPFVHETAANPFEPSSVLAYSTYSEGSTLDLATLDLYFDVLSYAGDAWVGEHTYSRQAWPSRYDDTLLCMYDAAMPDSTCVEEFAERYLMSAVLHDIPASAEVDRLAAFAQEALDEEYASGASRDSTVQHITSAAWLHTYALFDSEIGQDVADDHGRHRLTDWEAATLISDMISDLGPGTAGVYLYDNDLSGEDRFTAEEGGHLAGFVEAAMDGSIQSADIASTLLRDHAMGLDPDREDEWIDYGTHSLAQRRRRSEEWMSDKLDRFFLEFFDVQSFQSGFQDSPQSTSQFDGESSHFYERALNELRSYESYNEPDGLMTFTDSIARIIVSDQDVLKQLLTTRDYYLPATGDPSTDYTPRLFDLNTSIGDTREDRWVTFPSDQRVGILTHPVWLAAHGAAFEDGPSVIHRGKWIREKLLCESVPPLELVTVEAQLIPSDPSLRARDRIEESIETNAECMACHQSMNSLGYPFEIYNHAGLLRVDDHGYAPDGSTTLINLPDPTLNRAYEDAIDLMEALGDSAYVKRCFIRQTFRFFAGRDETPTDACVLADMEASYDTSDGSFVSMLETLATHDSSMYRIHGDSP